MTKGSLSCDFSKMMENKNTAVKKLTGGLSGSATPAVWIQICDVCDLSFVCLSGIEGLFKRDKAPVLETSQHGTLGVVSC